MKSFEDFTVATCNEAAYKVMKYVANCEGIHKTPFGLLGPSGCGKTALLNAVYNSTLEKRKDLKIVYTTGEMFVNEFIYAIKNQCLCEFRAKHRDADIYILDDIHFFKSREESQEELAYTLECLQRKGTQIVFTSILPQIQLETFENYKLKSFFSEATYVKIDLPDIETKEKILENYILRKGLERTKDLGRIIFSIATSNEGDIRAVISALNRVIVLSDILEETITVEFVERVLNSD